MDAPWADGADNMGDIMETVQEAITASLSVSAPFFILYSASELEKSRKLK